MISDIGFFFSRRENFQFPKFRLSRQKSSFSFCLVLKLRLLYVRYCPSVCSAVKLCFPSGYARSNNVLEFMPPRLCQCISSFASFSPYNWINGDKNVLVADQLFLFVSPSVFPSVSPSVHNDWFEKCENAHLRCWNCVVFVWGRWGLYTPANPVDDDIVTRA